MKKNTCPYLESPDKCTHKANNYGKLKHLNKCPYNKENKCLIYKQWEKEKKSFTTANRTILDDLKLRGVILE